LNGSVELIPVARLALAFLPVAVTLAILWRWSQGVGVGLYAVARMLAQLVLIGYVLTFIFAADRAWMVLAVLGVMLTSAGWIALRPLARRDAWLLSRAVGAIAVGSVTTLALVTQGVLAADPWYAPRLLIPLAGIVFANSMNAVSLGAERYEAELATRDDLPRARAIAMRTAMIPQLNALFAVGLVSLPGMMTGQILSGVEPLIAVRYQIVIMASVFGSAGIATACYLWWMRSRPAPLPPRNEEG